MLIEGLVFIAGLALYLRVTRSINNFGKYGFWAMIGLLVLIHLSNLFGSPPANATTLAWVGETQWLFVIWAFLVDKHRALRTQEVTDDPVTAVNAR